jgi:hypothetical protein
VDGRSALWTAQAGAAALPELDAADDELDELDDEVDDFFDALSDFDDEEELSDLASDFDSDFDSDFFAESAEDSFVPFPARLSLR